MSNEILNGLRTYRPEIESYVFFSDSFEGQVKAWIDGVRTQRASRALLITGPAGMGKTTLALALCRALGAVEQDIQEINCANRRTLNDARDLMEGMMFMPSQGNYRVLILDECHQLVNDAQQAFLTPIEKLPAHALFICCTTDPEKLSVAFRSRFYELRLDAYTEESIADILVNLPLKLKPAQIATIAKVSQGNPRRAISLVEKHLHGDEISDEQIETIKKETLQRFDLLEALLEQDPVKSSIYVGLLKPESFTIELDLLLRDLDYLWKLSREIAVMPPKSDLAQYARLLQKRKNYRIAWLFAQLVTLREKTLLHLKAWAMNLPPLG
jgi:DNA polymerase-3 subunit gamma/tau